jgi:hypothetical protein
MKDVCGQSEVKRCDIVSQLGGTKKNIILHFSSFLVFPSL